LYTTSGKHREMLQDTGTSNDLLNRMPIAQELKARIDTRDNNKLKNVFMAKEIINKGKGQHTEWKKFLPAIHLTKH
jgi:hypothetical protein